LSEGSGSGPSSPDEKVPALLSTPGLSVKSLDPSTKEKVVWPPTKEDLQRLYVDEKLSAAKIAKVYGLKTGNPRSASFLVTYHLKKHGIERRDRVEELRKETEAAAAAWRAKYPKKECGEQSRPAEEGWQADEPIRLAADEKAVIELLQHKNLSIRHLDPETKGRVKAAMEGLHWTRGLSLNDIADLVGNKTSGYSSYLFKELGIKPRPFEEARLKGIHDHVRIHERKPFDGTDEDKAYMLGVAHGDLHIATPWNGVISASTSTTHPAMVQLFRSLFSQYGHVYLLPRYKYDTETYEWNLQVILDDTFRFLLLEHREAWRWVSQLESTLYSYLAGVWDAEGSFEIRENRKVVAIRLPIYNTNLSLVEFIISKLRGLGYTPWGPYLAKRKGDTSSKWGIPLRKDYWKAEVLDLDQSQSILTKLPLRHREKVGMKELALVLERGDRWEHVEAAAKVIRDCIKCERDRFLAAARLEF
jgi:hypothetical protein